jgi:hypothetical protein
MDIDASAWSDHAEQADQTALDPAAAFCFDFA